MSFPTIYDVVQAFGSSFKSIDFRTIMVKPEDQWINVITSVFLANKSQEEIKSEHQQLKDKLSINTSKFRFLPLCYSFKDGLELLLRQLMNGEVSRFHIKFREIDLSELRVDQFPSYLKEMKEWKLVGAETNGTEGYRTNLWHIINSQNENARRVGYKDIYELINETLRIRDFYQGRTRDLVVGIPLLARIADMSLDDSSLKIKTKKVISIADLQLNLVIERLNPQTRHYERVWRKIELVKECKQPLTHDFCYADNSIKLPNLNSADMIDAELIHRRVPTLSIDQNRLIVPLQKPVEPFAKTLFSFCPLDSFRERLLNPEKFKKPSKEFEDAVAWLLSLIGFSVVQLRNFETLRISKTSYQVGSIDMIAHTENESVILVDCDTSIPDDKKIRSMKAVKDYFKFIQDENRRPNIVSIIFSPKDCTGISVGFQDVKIIDGYKIEWMLEEAINGYSEEARNSLA